MRSLSPSRTLTCTRTVSPAFIAGRSAICDFSTSSIAPISRSFKLSQQLQFFLVEHRIGQQIRPPIERPAQGFALAPAANLRVVAREQHVGDLQDPLGGGRRAPPDDFRRPRVLREIEQPARERTPP